MDDRGCMNWVLMGKPNLKIMAIEDVQDQNNQKSTVLQNRNYQIANINKKFFYGNNHTFKRQ